MKITTVLSLGILLLSLAGCKDKIEPGTAKVERPVVAGVSTMTVQISEAGRFHDATATVTAKSESMIASRIMGPVMELHVKEGDRVTAGQLLVVIDSEDINNKVAAAAAGHREALQALNAAEQNKLLAETTYKRFKNLYDENALTQQELDKVETQKKVAAIEYERVQQMVTRAAAGMAEATVFLGYQKVASPVNGVVTGKFIDPGTMAMPGMHLFTIEDNSSYRLEADIDESLAGDISLGMQVDIEISSLKLELQGEVSDIVPAIDPRSRTFKVFIAIQHHKNLRSGMYARARFPVGQKEIIMVGQRVVVEKGQLTGIYVVDDNRVITYRLVRIGKKFGDQVEILSGLKPGETIITDNLTKVKDGGILQKVGSDE
ncbi:MAG: efflux RND transporter periplasmic adaptor subunit [Proteobacteria bacterium]|nr:efflux RND transporter periplasmic adaptor subunit [Pseudomonadota bacterium]